MIDREFDWIGAVQVKTTRIIAMQSFDHLWTNAWQSWYFIVSLFYRFHSILEWIQSNGQKLNTIFHLIEKYNYQTSKSFQTLDISPIFLSSVVALVSSILFLSLHRSKVESKCINCTDVTTKKRNFYKRLFLWYRMFGLFAQRIISNEQRNNMNTNDTHENRIECIDDNKIIIHYEHFNNYLLKILWILKQVYCMCYFFSALQIN